METKRLDRRRAKARTGRQLGEGMRDVVGERERSMEGEIAGPKGGGEIVPEKKTRGMGARGGKREGRERIYFYFLYYYFMG